MDSACAGSLTNKRSLLVNIRPCSERFVGSDGVVESAECIGDMPVLAVDGSGKIVKKTFTNVRCVPKFEFTLLSVVQLWEEQRIDSLFANLKHLQFPADEGGIKLPYAKAHRLPTLRLVSAASGKASSYGREPRPGAPAKQPARAELPTTVADLVMGALGADQLGFHRVGYSAFVRKLPASQAAELL